MRNRFPGYCYKCGSYVPTGYGFFERLRRPENGRKWRVQCVKCCDGRDVEPWHKEVKRAERLRAEYESGKGDAR